MSGDAAEDGLDIRSGGVVAVDTADLRDAAAVLVALAGECEALERELASITIGLGAHVATAWTPAELGDALARDAGDAARAAADLARGLRDAADVYEIVELEAARWSAEVAADHRALPFLRERLHDARERMPEAAARADLVAAGWPAVRHAELQRQIAQAGAPFGVLGDVASVVAGFAGSAVALLGAGRVAASSRLDGSAAPMRVAPFAAPAASAPRDLATLAERMPRGDDQVRVERYPQPGGGNRFAVYVAGTKSIAFGPFRGVEPLDMTSNLELYAGAHADSYDAVVEALRDAGARRGDAVLAVGHSQGGAITSRLALEGEFDVQANVTFGSPVHADPGRDALDVTLRHADDPVAALQAGGHPAGVGAPGSIVVERVADPGGSIIDLGFGAHAMDAYSETATLVDGSSDPRLGELRDVLGAFGGASPAVVTTYHLRRHD